MSKVLKIVLLGWNIFDLKSDYKNQYKNDTIETGCANSFVSVAAHPVIFQYFQFIFNSYNIYGFI